MLLNALFALVTLPTLVLAHSLTAKTLGQLPLGTWLESVAVRSNGDLLVTQLWPSAAVYTISNPSAGDTALKELVSIPSIQGILGIAQVPKSPGKPETFVVVGSNATGLSQLIPGTFGAWTIEFQHRRHQAKVKVKKISDMSKESTFLNGVVAIPGVSDAVLVSDSFSGLVGRLDLCTGVFDTSAFVFPEMAPISAKAFGINGIKIRNNHLYFTNSNAVKIYRIAITAAGFPVKGSQPQLVADLSKSVSFLDDFDFDSKGNIYVASNFDNSVVFVDVKSGKWRTVVGGIDEMTVAGSTAVAFGREKQEKHTLFVVTSGALAKPVDGTRTEGAKVVAVDTRP
ncbi:hypothetical protein FOPG_17621 [Fusarium oxysporum f. sp. conglutinans race 2 54008]|uniref:SMP-30/Gluconolactonase/LRE-like region domain-containing protein n=3 Tax=Fusarium oxysporum f. sp. conglutinans TaxID=100902 RepID=A0A8H6GXM5_FUSOX|nr:hypothetical protein FOXB_15498 [Fusarium oxysporum f. sp. conglutinans Fo5176]EXL66180.1 hypothetical protein FOPG_17621 [Fusarium oxysporum f. sp. conglutinans race 2 54008]KAF6525285.1 hypothetical protein HZS61_011080 [Fusarium oxysporum f. sp. conglutinans]KAG6996452.1 hypothetical protein FocnCong_v015676 [Fusarium oxysporum f. sp. conglutinans]KAI8411695.1 hypothetical protein FOFC_08289 [Fusarium oxysporum]